MKYYEEIVLLALAIIVSKPIHLDVRIVDVLRDKFNLPEFV